METKALYKLAEEENITIDNVRLPLTKAFSLMDEEGDCFVALDYSQITNDSEERVMLAHELGHCVRGAFYNRYSAVDCKSRHERRANVWAYRKLVSEDELHEAVMRGNVEIWQLAEYFDLPQNLMEQIVNYYEGIE